MGKQPTVDQLMYEGQPAKGRDRSTYRRKGHEKKFGRKFAFEISDNVDDSSLDQDGCYFNRNYKTLIKNKEVELEPAIEFLRNGIFTEEEYNKKMKSSGFKRWFDVGQSSFFHIYFYQRLEKDEIFEMYKDYLNYKDAYERYDDLYKLSQERAIVTWILMRPKEFRKEQMEESQKKLKEKVDILLDSFYEEYEIVLNSLEKYYDYSQKDNFFYKRPKRETVHLDPIMDRLFNNEGYHRRDFQEPQE